MPGPLQALVSALGLGGPDPWLAAGMPPAAVPPGGPFVGPLEAPPPLTGWRAAADRGLDAVVGTVKGLTGLGDQGPAGPTVINAAAIVGALPAGLAAKLPRFAKALEAYRAPTAAGRTAAPFFSRLDEAVAALPKQTFGPKIAGVVQKGQAATEELAARGVPEFLAAAGNKPIQRAALEAHLEAHPVPQLDVKVLGEPAPAPMIVHTSTLEARPDYGGPSAAVSPWATVDARTGDPYSFHQTRGNAEDYIREFGADAPAPAPTKFSSYQLPGGANYRETLITLPQPAAHAAPIAAAQATLDDAEAALRAYRAANPDAEALGLADPGYRAAVLARNEAGIALTKARAPMIESRFKSSHFDEPNILAHTRSNEREIPGLGRGVFLEEVQSDWHQQGKAKGYATADQATAQSEMAAAKRRLEAIQDRFDQMPTDPAEREALAGEQSRLTRRHAELEANEARRATSRAVPDAPFKETWPDLALKHHLAEAAQDPSVHWIGFTSGKTQAARYDLSKQIDRLEWLHDAGDAKGSLIASKGREEVINDYLTPDELADHIGKEAATKLLAQPETRGVRRLEGVDLQVGGEGMHEFYDKLLPKRLEKIVKPYGGVVERMPLASENAAKLATQNEWHRSRGAITEAEYLKRKAQQAPPDAWILKLTPALKERILKYGLPLMAGVAAVDAGAEGSR